MAQSQVASVQPPGIDTAGRVSEQDLHDIRQYERILEFRDLVLSGGHPTIKLPPGVPAVSRQSSLSARAAKPVEQGAGLTAAEGKASSANSASASAEKRADDSGSRETQINPVLLKKPPELVGTEFSLRRQRLEREIKAEVEQRRTFKQDKPEPLADFDLTDVLAKALTLVQATSAPAEPAAEGPATNDEAASDSFDDATFYSSKHNTPESHLTSRVVRPSPGDVPAPNGIPGLHVGQTTSSRNDRNDGPRRDYAHEAEAPRGQPNPMHIVPPQPGLFQNSAPSAVPVPFQIPALNNYAAGFTSSGQASQVNTSAEQSQSDGDANADTFRATAHRANIAGGQLPGDDYLDTHPPSPLIRTHDMVPVAPQPAPVPQYVVDQQWGHALDPGSASSTAASGARGEPAQVVALRNEPIALHSPDSSPQSGRGSDRKKDKKKKRKADRQAPEEVMPYIKPEPRSQSPISAPNHIRPAKRQRQAHKQGNDFGHEDRAAANNPQPQQDAPRPYQGQPAPVGYGVLGGQPQRASSTVVAGDPRYSAYVDDRAPLEGAYVRRVSPRYIQQSAPAYPPRPVSQVYLDDSGRAYREPYEVSRMSVRPDAEPYVGQPMPPPPAARIIVDSFGREYIEPPRPAPRHSVAPAPSHGPEMMYDRPPPPPPARALSRHPGPSSYHDNGGVVYTRASSAYPGPPRRVVTQPEYASQSFRESHPQDYQTRPSVAPPTEYVQVMGHSEHQPAAEAPREYAPRATSTRPPPEPVRYEIPGEYGHGRIRSVQPPPPVREYAGGAYPPESRREPAQPYLVEYGPRPVEQQPVYRGYSVHPVERYYEQQRPARAGEDIAFIERPRGATQEIVYADDVRREVYRQ